MNSVELKTNIWSWFKDSTEIVVKCDIKGNCNILQIWVRVMVFSVTFNNISVILWWSVLLVVETVVPGENHRPVPCHWQTLLYNYTPRKHSLSGPTSTSFVQFPPSFVEFKITMCELCSIKDCIIRWVLPLLCLFGLRNFETIQYALCHRKFSYMINQKFMKLCTLQDPNMKMCTLVGYPGPLSFTPVMLLWT